MAEFASHTLLEQCGLRLAVEELFRNTASDGSQGSVARDTESRQLSLPLLIDTAQEHLIDGIPKSFGMHRSCPLIVDLLVTVPTVGRSLEIGRLQPLRSLSP